MVAVPDVHDGRRSDPGHDHRKGHRQFHHPEELPGAHAHPPARLPDPRIDLRDAHIGIPDQRELTVEDEGDQRRLETDPDERDEDPEEGEARNRVEDPRHPRSPGRRPGGTRVSRMPTVTPMTVEIEMAIAVRTICSRVSRRISPRFLNT